MANAREAAITWLATVWFNVVMVEHVAQPSASDEITFSQLFNKYCCAVVDGVPPRRRHMDTRDCSSPSQAL